MRIDNNMQQTKFNANYRTFVEPGADIATVGSKLITEAVKKGAEVILIPVKVKGENDVVRALLAVDNNIRSGQDFAKVSDTCVRLWRKPGADLEAIDKQYDAAVKILMDSPETETIAIA